MIHVCVSLCSVALFICVSGPSGEVHQVCIRNQQHWPAAHGASEQNGERDDRLWPLRRGHYCWVERRTERVVGWPAGADGDPQTNAGSIAPAAQVFHRLQGGMVTSNIRQWLRCALFFLNITGRLSGRELQLLFLKHSWWQRCPVL